MEEVRFEVTYGRGREYTRVPFEVPVGTGRIEVAYDYERHVEERVAGGLCRRERNVIDLGLYDPSGDLYGWSGSQRREVYISGAESTPGYRHGEIRPGRWAVALGVYRVEGAARVVVTVRLYPKERRLYRGDPHVHTVNSDGVYPTAFVLDSCVRAGLDFVGLTDHNNTVQNGEAGAAGPVTVIPGVECTNYRGHANFHWSDPRVDFRADYLANTADEMAAVLARARESGARITINHPHSPCPWEFGYDVPFDLLEVWNGPMRGDNMAGVALWQDLLRGGRRVSAVGGSDLHANDLGRVLGAPCTYVWAMSRSPGDLLTALVEGRGGVTFAPGGPVLEMRVGPSGGDDAVGLGEARPWEPGLECAALARGARRGDTLRAVARDGEAAVFTAPFDGDFEARFPASRPGFYRLELYRALLETPVLCALSNPVYLDG